jgi:hypothetical protein
VLVDYRPLPLTADKPPNVCSYRTALFASVAVICYPPNPLTSHDMLPVHVNRAESSINATWQWGPRRDRGHAACFAASCTLLERALDGREKALELDRPPTLDTVDNLGILYRSSGHIFIQV